MESLIQDFRYGLRMLRKSPSFTTIAVLTLALGIGSTTAIFSVVHGVLLLPLPYNEPSRIVLVPDPEDSEQIGVPYLDLAAWRSQSRAFDNLAIYYKNSGWSRVTLTGAGEPASVQGAFVSTNFFPVMGIAPMLGRVFTLEEETRHERVVVLSYDQWVSRFGASRDVIGQLLQIEGANAQVIGVMPANFKFPGRESQFWAPITTNRYWNDPEVLRFDPTHSQGFYKRWNVVGRLKPEASYRDAELEANTILARFRRGEPAEEGKVSVAPLRVNLGSNVRLALQVLFGATFLVLLIACSNVANLVLARGATRAREMAVRTALGAGRGRLIRHLFVESVLLAGMAAGLGLIIANFSVRAMIALGPPDIPRLEQVGLDTGVFAFALGMSALSAILFGLIPAWSVSRCDPNDCLKVGDKAASASQFSTRARNLLVVAEIAISVVLLSGATLLVRSLQAIEALDTGFRPEQVLTMQVTMPSGMPDSRSSNLYDGIEERVRALPGVKAVGAIDGLFELGGTDNLGLRQVEGHAPEPGDRWTALTWKVIRGNYFEAMGSRLSKGRYFSEQDSRRSPLVAIVDESMARRYWPGEDPIGKRFKGQDPRGTSDDWLTVVGVVSDMRRGGLEKIPTPHIYEWYLQANYGDSTPDLVVRTATDAGAFAGALRGAVRELDDNAILSPVTTLEQQLSDQLSPRRFQMSLLGLFSFVALVLACSGISGSMHYNVVQRTHEIGIRLALGARSRNVLVLLVGQGGRLVVMGAGIGLLTALVATRWISSLLFGVSAADPVTFSAVLVFLILAGLLACVVPAYRATRVDPIVALRYE